MTLLAWGNSAGDLVTNVAVAKAGFPGMAIAGSYGGPLFNVLLGIGLPMFYSCVRYGGTVVDCAAMRVLDVMGLLFFSERLPSAVSSAYSGMQWGLARQML